MPNMQLAFNHVKEMVFTHSVKSFQKMITFKGIDFYSSDLLEPVVYRRIDIN